MKWHAAHSLSYNVEHGGWQWRVRTLGLLPDGRRQFTDAPVPYASYASYGSFAAQFSDVIRCLQMSSGSFFVSCQISGSCLCTMRLRAHRLQQCNKCKCCSMFAQNFRPRGRKNAQGKRIALPVDLPFRHVRFPSLGVANHNGMHHPIQAIYRCE